MLRRCVAMGWCLASLGLGSALVGCGSAAPVDIGSDYVVPVSEVEPAPPSEAAPVEEPPVAESGTGDDVETGEVPPPLQANPNEFDSFVSPDVSQYCRASFEPCGGLLVGTWEVESNCSPEVRDPNVLQPWGEARMDLDANACGGAVQRLTMTWTGQLTFEYQTQMARDDRTSVQTVELGLNAACVGATRELDDLTSVSPEMCGTFEDESTTATTTCALAGGVCMCSTRTKGVGRADGVYHSWNNILGVRDADTPTRPLKQYEYCVEGNRMLWREGPGSPHLVFIRTVDAPPGAKDPVEEPR